MNTHHTLHSSNHSPDYGAASEDMLSGSDIFSHMTGNTSLIGERAMTLTERLRGINNYLAGAVPEPGNATPSEKQREPASAIEALIRSIDFSHAQISELEQQVARLCAILGR